MSSATSLSCSVETWAGWYRTVRLAARKSASIATMPGLVRRRSARITRQPSPSGTGKCSLISGSTEAVWLEGFMDTTLARTIHVPPPGARRSWEHGRWRPAALRGQRFAPAAHNGRGENIIGSSRSADERELARLRHAIGFQPQDVSAAGQCPGPAEVMVSGSQQGIDDAAHQ